MYAELMNLINQGGVVSMAVAVILLVMSVGSWTLMVVKSVQLRLLKRNNAAFVAGLNPNDCHFALLGQDAKGMTSTFIFEMDSIRAAVSQLLDRQGKASICPYARLAVHALNAAEQHKWLASEMVEPVRVRDEHITLSLRRTLANETIQMETGLTLLASIGSISPFVGLFGTVWGIYHALGAIAHNGQATVDKVAGPVGEALIMTAFGLAVAMPAVLAYNAFIRDNRLLAAEMENFAHDLFASITLAAALPSKPAVKAATTNKPAMAVAS